MAAFTPKYTHIKAKEYSLPVLTNYSECYTELGLIGEGSFGNVVLARREVDTLVVAVKTVRIYTKKLLGNVRRAMKEVSIIKRLNNVDIPIIYDEFLRYDNNKKLVFSIVMEYIEGGNMETLFQDLVQNMDLSQPDVRQQHREFIQEFMLWMYHTLSNMHTQGIVHRDIKPSNIMYRSDPLSGQSRYVLIDLGFGCIVEGLRTLRASPGLFKRKFTTIKVDDLNDIIREIDLTCPINKFIGTIFYSPPEAFKRLPEISELKSYDIWSSGIMMNEFIHLSVIFDINSVDVAGLNRTEANDKIIDAYIKLTTTPFACRYMPPFDRAIMESLALDPKMRPAANSILNFILAWLNGSFPTEIVSGTFDKIYLEY